MEIKDEVLNLDAVGFVGGLEDDEETVTSRLARWRQRLGFESHDLESNVKEALNTVFNGKLQMLACKAN